MPVVNKTLYRPLVTREEATEINCKTLYELLKDELKTDKVVVSIKGATLNPFGGHSTHTFLVHLPRTFTMMVHYLPVGYDLFEIKVDYTLDYLDPSVRMTRADFVIELYQLWEDVLGSLPPDSPLRVLYAGSQELLTSTYQARELGNQDYLEETNVS